MPLLVHRIKTDGDSQVFQGIGGGGMTTVVSILLSDIVPLRDRGVWQGILNIIYATGSGLGAPIGTSPAADRLLSVLIAH